MGPRKIEVFSTYITSELNPSSLSILQRETGNARETKQPGGRECGGEGLPDPAAAGEVRHQQDTGSGELETQTSCE